MKNCCNWLQNKKVLIVSVLLIVWGCSKLEENVPQVEYINPIEIGVIGPLSEIRSLAETRNLTIMLAIEEINRNGGINNRDLKPIFKDDAGKADVAVQSVNELYDKGVLFLIAPVWSRVALAVSEQVCIPKEMLFIGSVTTSPEVSTLEDNNLIWRTTPSDHNQGRLGARYISQELNKKTVGVIYLDDPYANELAKVFISSFEDYEGNVLSSVQYPRAVEWNTFDFKPYIEELIQNKPEVIYFVSFSQDASKFSHDLAEGEYFNDSYRPLLFSTDGPFTSDFLVNAHPEIVEGMQGTQPAPDPLNSNNKIFIENFNQRYGIQPVQFCQETYDAVYLLAYAMLLAETHEPKDVSYYLPEVSGANYSSDAVTINVNEFAKAKNIIESGGSIDYDGASGKIEFDSNGDPSTGSYIIYHIIQGEYTVDTTIYF